MAFGGDLGGYATKSVMISVVHGLEEFSLVLEDDREAEHGRSRFTAYRWLVTSRYRAIDRRVAADIRGRERTASTSSYST